jgi:hypothetical protein
MRASRYTIAAVIGVLIVQHFWSTYSQIETIPYSEFEQLLNENKIDEVTISADAVQGTLKEALPNGKREFFAVRVDPHLVDKLLAHGVVVKGSPSGGIIQTRALVSSLAITSLARTVTAICSAAEPNGSPIRASMLEIAPWEMVRPNSQTTPGKRPPAMRPVPGAARPGPKRGPFVSPLQQRQALDVTDLRSLCHLAISFSSTIAFRCHVNRKIGG